MSINLTTNKVKEFDDMVKQAYQTMGSNLRDTVRVKNGVRGDQVQFPKMGKGVGVRRGTTQTNIVEGSGSKLMNIGQSNVVATILDYVFPEMTDMFDQAEVNYNEQSELAKVITAAMGRRVDQSIIDALIATSGNGSVAVGTTGFTTVKLLKAKQLLDAKGVPMTDRHIALSSIGLQQLLQTTEITSSDFNTVKALVHGDLDTFLGFKFHMIEDRAEGGLPISTNDRTCMAWHKDALGMAVSIEPMVEVNYLPEYVSYLANGMLDVGSIAIDADGIVDIHIDESK